MVVRRALWTCASRLAGPPRLVVARRAALALGTSCTALAACERAVFTPVQQEDLAITLSERLSVGPFLLMPQPLKLAIASKLVAAVADAVGSADLDDRERAEIRRAAESYTEGVSAETVAHVVRAVNARVNLPLVDEATERELISQAVGLLLGDTCPLQLLGAAAQGGGGIVRRLVQPEQRARLAAALAARVDLPLLDEAAERQLIERAVGTLGAALEQLLPAELVASLDGLDAEELAALKQLTAQRLQLPALPFVPAAEQQRVVAALVDAAFDTLVDSELGGVVLAPCQQLERLRRAEAGLRAEAAAVARAGARKQADYARRLAALEEQKRGVKKGMRRGWLW